MNYTSFGVFGALPQFKETVEPGTLSHWFILHPVRYFASLKATTISSYTCFGYWGHFHILEKLGLSLGRVFSAIWGVMALWSKLTGHSVRCRDPTSLSSALGQKLIAQMQWLALGDNVLFQLFIFLFAVWLPWGSQTADKKVNSWNKEQITQSFQP